jgi:RimJ/RimL family protein N-acetyltransferase
MTIPQQLAWSMPLGELLVIDAVPGDIAVHAAALAAAYNDPRNMSLLGHTAELTPDDVIDHYRAIAAQRGLGFLLFRDGQLAGDADLRGLTVTARRHGGGGESVAEFAFLIATPAAQGKGLGTAFATMIHTIGFRDAGLDRIYAAILPTNVASRRVFEKLGYTVDSSEAARGFGDEGDVVMSIDRATFVREHAQAMAQMRRTLR